MNPMNDAHISFAYSRPRSGTTLPPWKTPKAEHYIYIQIYRVQENKITQEVIITLIASTRDTTEHYYPVQKSRVIQDII